ncbi:hypothetical protein XENTR_v10007942 [Xenopus tropicalis]|nr:hypothetical protein XENTR_v10007942 [Xenopus tropicalis]
MKEVEGSLLALIHQHLLQAGYSKAARELQMQSGKKFSTPEVSLQDIYKDWIKHPEKDKTKKTVQVNNQGVKVRVPDPESSTESSEDELVFYSPAGSRTLSNATPQVQQTKEKNNKKKPTAKEKAATTISKMSSGVNATSGQNKKAVSAIPQAPKVVMESSSSSDSEEDQAPQKAAPVKISTKPVAESTESSSGSESDMETTGQNVVGKKLTANNLPATPGSVKKPLPNAAPNGKVASQAKAIVKPDLKNISESSDSSDSEEENESQTHTVLAHVHAPPRTPLLSPSKTARAAVPAKAAVVTKPVDIDESESSDSSDSEIIVTQASQKKPSDPTAAKPLVTKTPNLAQPGKVATPTKTPVSAKPLTAQSSESSDSSDSEEELNAKNTAAPLQASQKKTIVPPTSTRPPGTKTPLLAKPGTLTTPAKASVVAQSSESSDSSDSELEPDAKKTAAPLQGSQKNIPATPSTATRPPGTKTPLLAKPGNLATPAKASMVAQPPAAQSSESSDLSDSEEEPNAKKTAAPLQGSQKKTPATAARPPETKAPLLAKPGKLATPTKASVVAQPLAAQSSESSDSSDSEEEPDAKKTAAPLQGSQKKTPATPSTATRPPGTKTPLLTKPGKLATPTKTPVISLPLAESSDSSESEDEPAVKNAQLSVVASKNNSKTTLLAKTGKLAAPAKTPAVTQPPVAESSESSNSSDSEEELNNKKTAAPPQASQKKGKSPLLASTGNAATPAKTPVVAQPLTAQSSESSNSSDSEEEPDAKKINASLNPTTSASQAFATMKPTAKQDCDSSDTSEEAEGKSRSLVGQPSVTIISETSDTTDIDEVVSPTPAPIKATKGKAVPILAKTVTPSSLKATKSKASSAAKTAKAVQQIAVANSDSSDSLDSDEDPGVKQTPSVPLKKVKSGKGAKLTAVCVSGGNQKLPSSLPVPSLQKPSVSDVSEPSDSSDSDIDTGAQSLVAPVHAVPTPQKRKRNPKVKAQVTQPPAASVKHKKKSKAEQLAASAQPAPEPVIDSEEETIMALLSGQSPKKGKQKLSKLGLKAAPSATPLPVQKNGSVSDSSDDSDIGTATLNIVTPPALELRPPTADKEKKSAKKRKSSSEDGPKKKAKKAKKEGKKEKKKSKAEGGEAGASTPKAKSSKKDKKKLEKSEKKKSSKKKKEKKKKDGEKKEAKKTKKGSATGVSPKPKKKKKSKADKVD